MNRKIVFVAIFAVVVMLTCVSISNVDSAQTPTEVIHEGGIDNDTFAESYELKNNIAEINGNGFVSIQTAIEQATDGQTIELTGNVTANETIEINKSITIDGKGQYSITTGADVKVSILIQTDGITVNLNNVDITNTYASASDSNDPTSVVRILAADYSTLNIDGCTFSTVSNNARGIDARGSMEPQNPTTIVSDVTINLIGFTYKSDNAQRAVGFYGAKDSKITISKESDILVNYYAINLATYTSNINVDVDDSKIQAWAVLNSYAVESNFAFTNSELVGYNDFNYDAEGWSNFAILVMDGGSYNGMEPGTASRGNIMTVERCTLTAETVKGNNQAIVAYQYWGQQNSVIMNDCTVVTKGALGDGSILEPNIYINATGSKLTVDGMEIFIPDTGSDESLTVSFDPVAIIGNTGYVQLADAVAAAPENGSQITIRLVDDCEVTGTGNDLYGIVIPENVDILLDLNGHSVSATVSPDGRHYYAFRVFGSLTVMDGTEEQKGIIEGHCVEVASGGSLTLQSGTLCDVDDKGASVVNYGTFTMTGGTLKVVESSEEASCLNNRETGVATVTGGSFISPNWSVCNLGNLDVSNVTFTTSDDHWNAIKIFDGLTTIDGCTFNLSYGGGVEVTSDVANGLEDPVVTIKNSTFTQSNIGSVEPYNSMCVAASGGSSVTVENCTFDTKGYAFYVFNSGGSITVNGGTYTSTGGKGLLRADLSTNNNDSSITVNGGTFIGKVIDADAGSGEDVRIQIAGGTFSEGFDQKYVVPKNGVFQRADGTWSIFESVIVTFQYDDTEQAVEIKKGFPVDSENVPTPGNNQEYTWRFGGFPIDPYTHQFDTDTTLVADSEPVASTPTVTFMDGDDLVAAVRAEDGKVTPPAPTKAGLVLTWMDCEDEASFENIASDVTFTASWSPATPVVEINQDITSPVQGQTVTLTADISNDGTGNGVVYTYEWNGVAGDSTLSVKSSGEYTVIVTATYDGKTAEGSCTVEIIFTEPTPEDPDKGETTVVVEEDGTTITTTEKPTETIGNNRVTEVTVVKEDPQGNTTTQSQVKIETDDTIVSETAVSAAAEHMQSVIDADEKVVSIETTTGQVTLPANISDITKAGATLEVVSNIGTVKVGSDVVDTLTSDNKDVTITQKDADTAEMNTIQQQAVGNNRVIELTASNEDRNFHQLGGTVEVVVKNFDLPEGVDADSVVVFYMDDNGRLSQKETVYDADTGLLRFWTDHFSYYVIGNTSMIAQDEPDDQPVNPGWNPGHDDVWIPPTVVVDDSDSQDGMTEIVACAAAAVVAALMAAFLIIERRKS